MLKINRNENLGYSIATKSMVKRQVEMSDYRFRMSKKNIIQYGVDTTKVADVLGMLMACADLGDLIAQTIRVGQNMTAVDFKKLVNKDGVLGERAVEVALFSAKLYWECWDKEAKCIDYLKATAIVAKRRGEHVPPVYTEKDILRTSNKYGMVRDIYTVCDYYLRRCEMFLNSINAETTLEELQNFQRAFVHPTRGLGEQTIDIKKDVTKYFYITMMQLISPALSVVGGIKELRSNIDAVKRGHKYEITTVDDKVRYDDVIGNFKQACVDEMEEQMNGFIDIIKKECNYSFYKKYESIDLLAAGNIEVASLIESVEDSLLTIVDDAAVFMDAEDIRRCLAGIYNLAEEVGVPAENVVKIAIKMAISSVSNHKGVVSVNNLIDSDKEYLIDMWKVSMLFGDIFVAEYSDTNVLEVEVPNYELEIDLEEGVELEITDGYSVGGYLHVFGPFQNGTVRVRDGKLYALYNPLEVLMDEHNNAVVLPVSYAKDRCKFSEFEAASVDDINNDAAVGFTALCEARAAKVMLDINKDYKNDNEKEYFVIAIGHDNTLVAAAKSDHYIHGNDEFFLKDIVVRKGLLIADRMATK